MKSPAGVLTKAALTVALVVVLLLAGIAALFQTSSLGQAPRSARAADRSLEQSRVATPGASGASGSAAGNPAAPARAPTPAPASPKPRQATDFSAADYPWDSLLARPGDTAAGAALAKTGKAAQGIAACASCHGADGTPAAGTPFPILAGLPASYQAKQLLDYQSGARQSPIMVPVAKGLSHDEIASVARYYAAIASPPLQPSTAADNDRGRHLHEFGDNTLALAACANCHGARGTGEAPAMPALAGQSEAYLTSQLQAFREGQRQNDDQGTMRAIAKRLSPEDTAALAKYYAGMRRP
jgi:cytochrome c553